MAASDKEPEEPNEETSTPKITYTLAIFSHAELAKAQRQPEPVARLLVLSSKLEWPDMCAQLKIKACDVLFPARATVNNDAFEVTFSIARHVPMPLPLATQTDYEHLVASALKNTNNPAAKITIKEKAVLPVVYFHFLTSSSAIDPEDYRISQRRKIFQYLIKPEKPKRR